MATAEKKVRAATSLDGTTSVVGIEMPRAS